MEKTKDWLLLNAVECWLHYCSNTTAYTDDYIRLRDEYREALTALDDSKDAQPAPKRTTRKRTTQSTK